MTQSKFYLGNIALLSLKKVKCVRQATDIFFAASENCSFLTLLDLTHGRSCGSKKL